MTTESFPVKLLLSTAYLPPAEYFSRIIHADEILIEREENYLKQSYRNRCYILSSNGPHLLTVPVYLGSLHKTPIKDIRIDYSKRWQQVHLRALTAAYASAPFFIFYFEEIEKIILENHTFLLDLNMELMSALAGFLKIQGKVSYTEKFVPAGEAENDYRFMISPKRESAVHIKRYPQVFECPENYLPRLSIVDLLFNSGPGAIDYL